MSTLLEAGYTPSTLGDENVIRVADFLEDCMNQGGGTVGFGMSDCVFPSL